MNITCTINSKDLITINNDFGQHYWNYCYHRGLADYSEKYGINQKDIEAWRECQGYYHTRYISMELIMMNLGLDEYLPNSDVRKQYREKAEMAAIFKLGLEEEEGLI